MDFDFKNPVVWLIAGIVLIAFLFMNRGNQQSGGTIQRVGGSEEMDKAILDFQLQQAGLVSNTYLALSQAKQESVEAEKQRAFDLQALQLQLQSATQIAQMQNAIESARIAQEMRLAQIQADLQRYAIKKSKGNSALSALFAQLPEFIRLGGSLITGGGIGGSIYSTPTTFPRYGF